MSRFCNTWFGNVKQLLYETGYQFLWRNADVSNFHISAIIQQIHDRYCRHFGDVSLSSKLTCYNLIKDEFKIENYIVHVSNSKYRQALGKLRGLDHKRTVETGRHLNILRENRTCLYCNMNILEDEYNFILVFPLYRDLRCKLLLRYYNCRWPSKQKFVKLFRSPSAVLLNNLANLFPWQWTCDPLQTPIKILLWFN